MITHHAEFPHSAGLVVERDVPARWEHGKRAGTSRSTRNRLVVDEIRWRDSALFHKCP